jgi:hypothetical protein
MLPCLQSSVREDEIAKLASSHMQMIKLSETKAVQGCHSLNEINYSDCVGMEGKCDQKEGPLKEEGSRGQSMI